MTKEEAINEIKSWDFLEGKEIEAIHTLIPELAESEDERIIKTLQEYVKNRNWPLNGPTQDEVLAWLEKQKEHQETCTKFLAKILKHSAEGFRNVLKKKGIDYIPHESFWTNTAGTFSKQECNEFYKWMDDMTMELVTEETPEYKKGFKDGKDSEKQKERGPLTEEEEYILHRIIEYLEDETCPSEWISLLHDIYCLPYEKQKEQKPLKVGENAYFDPNTEMWFIKEEQKPADLTKMMVHKEPYIAPVPTPMVADEQKPVEWSPTKEQMVALSWAANGMFDNDGVIKASLRTLYNDLQSKSIRPAEWSEEDEKTFWGLTAYVPDKELESLGVTRLDILKKVKSLRPQPKQEWSEEERIILDSIIDDYEQAAKSFCGYAGKIWFLKAIRDGEITFQSPQKLDVSKLENFDPVEVLNRIKKEWPMAWEKVVGKQEWSEEDSKRYISIGTTLATSRVLSREDYDADMSWLRDLVNIVKYSRLSWKPSEEEMKALKECGECKRCIKKLYEDLQKRYGTC